MLYRDICQWSGLSNCRLVNGRIIGYRVMLGTCWTTDTRDHELGDEEWRSGGEMILTGLTLSTNYTISVAAVNENGLYSDPITAMTHQCKYGIHIITHRIISASSLQIVAVVI